MKILPIALILAALMGSCAPLGPGDNPLDTPATNAPKRPSAMGHFGPHSEHYR